MSFDITEDQLGSPPIKIYIIYNIKYSIVDMFVLHENLTLRRIGFSIMPDGTYGPKIVWAGEVECERDLMEMTKGVLDQMKENFGPHNITAYSISSPSQEVLSEAMGQICDMAQTYSIIGQLPMTGGPLGEKESREEVQEREEDGEDSSEEQDCPGMSCS